jgi:putative transposase
MRTRYKINKDGNAQIYFVTSTIVEWIPVFTCADHFRILIDSLEYCRNKYDMKLYAFVIMENHFHLLAGAKDLSQPMQALKSYTSKKLLESIKEKRSDWLLNQLAFFKAKHKKESSYQVWQEGYHPQEMQDWDMLKQKIEYIHHNPVRRGYVERPEYWQYSSAKEILSGEAGVIKMDILDV